MESQGFVACDDMNMDWEASMRKVRAVLSEGRGVAVSDIEFCKEKWRARLESELQDLAGVRWIFFANEPYMCIRNVLFRSYVEGLNRPVCEEVRKIRDYAKVYRPTGDVRPVVLADSTPEGLAKFHGGRDAALRWTRDMVAALEAMGPEPTVPPRG
jgi:hypothetical protein